MKHKNLLRTLLLMLCIAVGWLAFTECQKEFYRYETVETSFQKSAPQETKLIKILEDKGVAVVIYQKMGSSDISSQTIGRDQRGWFPFTKSLSIDRRINWGSWNISVREYNGKSIFTFGHFIPLGEKIPEISDSMGNQALEHTVDAGADGTLFFALLVVDVSLPADYQIFYGTEGISVQ